MLEAVSRKYTTHLSVVNSKLMIMITGGRF